MPLISIIVPVYRVESYIHRCIESILAQTFTDFELILIDDGSPDNCPAICDEYAKNDKRIKAIHKQNAGVSSARNAGLCHALGEYIMFCDGDDTVHPKWCETMYNAVLRQPDAWHVCNINKTIDGELNQTCHKLENHISYFDVFKAGLSPYTVNKIFTKKILTDNNIIFNESVHIGEDIEFNIKYANVTSRINYIDKQLYNYYYNPNSATSTYKHNLFGLNLTHYNNRLPLIANCELPEFCDIYLFSFLQWLDNTMDPRNKMSPLQKMKYNHRMMNTPEFKHCVAHATGNNDSKLFMRIVKLHNYYIYWAFQKICALKNKLFAKKSGADNENCSDNADKTK